MFSSTILSIAIALVFIFLLLSIMVTALNELVFTILKSRSKQLEYFLENLFFNDKPWSDLFIKIQNSPFINVLKKYPERFPGAIPAENFADAILTLLGKGEVTLPAIQKAIAANSKIEKADTKNKHVPQSIGGFKNNFIRFFGFQPEFDKKAVRYSGFFIMLTSLASQSKTIEELKAKLEKTFDNSMERLTGWYRRIAKQLSFFFALLICVSLNIDTINLTVNLWNNKDKAEQIAGFAVVASKYMEKNDSSDIVFKSGFDTLTWVKVENKALSQSKLGKEVLKTDTTGDKKQQQMQLVTSYNIIANLDIPIGWTQENYPKCMENNFWLNVWHWILKVMGILLTSAAVSFGAPYWFDLLNKLTPLRQGGGKAASAKGGSGQNNT